MLIINIVDLIERTEACMSIEHISKMDPSSEITEADKVLWYKIKRNGNFRKRKRDLVRKNQNETPLNESGVKDPDPHTQNTTDDTGYSQYIIDAQHEPVNDEDVPKENHTLDNSDEEMDMDTNKLDPLEFCNEIRKWAVDFQIKHTALNALLLILKSHMPDNVLPKCARTLVQTPRSTVISSDERLGGKYWHYGLEKVLTDHLTRIEKVPEQVSLNINIDGLPAFKSSSTSFWPILVNIHELREILSPLIVGIFCGGSKWKY